MNHLKENTKSLFVVIEGVDSAGKTTLISMLEESISKDPLMQGIFDEIVYTKEPGASTLDFCKSIREIAIESPNISNETRALLFLANRSEHMEKLILPTIQKPRRLIICDRFYISTQVWQGFGNAKLIKWIQETHKMIAPIVPDLTFMVDISKKVFLERYQKRLSQTKQNFLDTYSHNEYEKIIALHKQFLENKDPLAGEIILLCGNSGVSLLVNTVKEKIIEKATSKSN